MACVFYYMPYVFYRMAKRVFINGNFNGFVLCVEFYDMNKNTRNLVIFTRELYKISKLLKGVLYFY